MFALFFLGEVTIDCPNEYETLDLAEGTVKVENKRACYFSNAGSLAFVQTMSGKCHLDVYSVSSKSGKNLGTKVGEITSSSKFRGGVTPLLTMFVPDDNCDSMTFTHFKDFNTAAALGQLSIQNSQKTVNVKNLVNLSTYGHYFTYTKKGKMSINDVDIPEGIMAAAGNMYSSDRITKELQSKVDVAIEGEAPSFVGFSISTIPRKDVEQHVLTASISVSELPQMKVEYTQKGVVTQFTPINGESFSATEQSWFIPVIVVICIVVVALLVLLLLCCCCSCCCCYHCCCKGKD